MLSSGRRRVLSVSCVFAVLAGGVLPVPAWADPGVSGVGPVSVAGAESAALAAAARSGEPVVVDALTTQTSVVTANPDGVLTMSSSSRPVRVREGSGWVPVDTSVVRGSDVQRIAAGQDPLPWWLLPMMAAADRQRQMS